MKKFLVIVSLTLSFASIGYGQSAPAQGEVKPPAPPAPAPEPVYPVGELVIIGSGIDKKFGPTGRIFVTDAIDLAKKSGEQVAQICNLQNDKFQFGVKKYILFLQLYSNGKPTSNLIKIAAGNCNKDSRK